MRMKKHLGVGVPPQSSGYTRWALTADTDPGSASPASPSDCTVVILNHLVADTPASRLGSRSARMRDQTTRTWFSLVSGETTAINKKENLSNTVTSHDFHICLTLILLYFLLPRFWERTLLFFFFLFSILTLCVCVCYRSCSLSTPARHLHKKTRAKAAPSLPWTSVTSWPPSGTTCWLRLSRRIWFQLSYYIFLF